jgi:cytidine deaminase
MKTIKKKLIKKADNSSCRYKISAIAFSKKNNVIGISFNGFRFSRYGGGVHAERKLMSKYGNKIDYIIICRTNGKGDVLPIEPCSTCQKIADKLNIKIKSI